MVVIAPLSALAAVGLTDLKTMLYVRRTIQICPFAGDRIRGCFISFEGSSMSLAWA